MSSELHQPSPTTWRASDPFQTENGSENLNKSSDFAEETSVDTYLGHCLQQDLSEKLAL